MKNFSIILNIILFLAILPLYYFQFGGEAAQPEQTRQASVGESSKKNVVYINTDSLFQNYDYYDDISKGYLDKRQKAEKQLESRTKKLENKYVSFQRRAQAGLMSQNEARQTEEELVQEQQDLQLYQQTVSAGLMEEEQILNQKLYAKIKEYLKDYNKEKNYEYILGYSEGNVIWLAEDGLDITEEILSGLNTAYAAEKSADSSASNQ